MTGKSSKKETKKTSKKERGNVSKKEVKTSKKTIKKNIANRKIVSDKDLAMDLAQAVHTKFDRMVKATVLFGSEAKNNPKINSDIDILIIIDDASINWDLELISWYREELGKLIKSFKSKKEFHINTIKLTTWWQDLMKGDPVVVNMLRYGDVLIDSGGFFTPIKALLLQGKIHSTPEAVYSALQRAPSHLARSKAAEMGAIEGVYWSMVDASQAALMTLGKVPPSPETIPNMLRDEFVSKGMLKEGLVRAMRDIYVLHKSIAHGEVSNLKGVEIDKWQETGEVFLYEITKIIDQLIESKKSYLN